MLSSRERVEAALNHREPDCVPLELGSTLTSGMQVNSVYLLRQALGLDRPGTPVKVIEPFQMLGEIKPDLMEALGVDTIGLIGPRNFFGFENEDWKPWTTPDGTPVLVPGKFNTDLEPNGDVLMYPEGDKSLAPSGRMPSGGWYFDAIIRQPPIDDAALTPEDNLEEFGPVSDADLAYYAAECARVHATGKAVFGNFGGTGFGDIALVPGVQLRNPRGIRDVEEWYISTSTRRDYVYQVFERQCEIALDNLAKIYEVVGNRVSAIFVTGTDFGMQTGPFISPRAYRDLFKPFHKRVNDWIHRNTEWKSLIHSCGSIWLLLDDMVEAGFDILNPVQISATNMAPQGLKDKYGQNLTFMGGGIDTQKVLPFGTPDDVRRQVRENMRIFGQGGGFIWAAIHNIQAGVPQENLLALFEAIREYRRYPLN